ncbi:helix-turn-helix transcriptional regulator [Fibrella sp. ES10-3-2-2]|nr:hypothetical protein A6C57_01355 [Fibrella sp. ES10-3-2-2]
MPTQPVRSNDQSITDANLPAIIAKIKLLQQALDLNSAEFADRVGISSATMSRINAETGASVSVKSLEKIVKNVQGLTIDWFFDSTTQLPSGLHIAPPASNENWEGTRLRRFRRRQELSQIAVAEASKTPPSNYSYYEKSQQIRPEIREKLLDAFTSLLGRPVSELEVFGRTNDIRPLPAHETGSFPIPRIPLSMRTKLTPSLIETLRYEPANQQGGDQDRSVYYIDSRLLHASQENIPAGQLTDYFALEFGSNDRMEPLRAGGWLLAQLLEPAQYSRLGDELVAVFTRHGGFYIRRIQRNALATDAAELVLVPYLNGSGAQISVRADDINLLFYIPTILHGPL